MEPLGGTWSAIAARGNLERKNSARVCVTMCVCVGSSRFSSELAGFDLFAVCVAAFGLAPGAMGCNTGVKGTKGAAGAQRKEGKGASSGGSGKGKGKTQHGSGAVASPALAKLEKQVGQLVELFKTKASKEARQTKDKPRWDCPLCQATGNWLSRDSCRSCKAPRQSEPVVGPPGLAGWSGLGAVKQPQHLDQAMEIDPKVEVTAGEDTRPALLVKIKECETLLKDMGEAEPGSRRAGIVEVLKGELAELRGKLAQSQPIASQLAIATAAKEKATAGVQAATKVLEEAEQALVEARQKLQEAVQKEGEARQHLEVVAAKVPGTAQISPQVAWAGVVQVLQAQGVMLEEGLKGLLAQALGAAEPGKEGSPGVLPGTGSVADPRQQQAAKDALSVPPLATEPPRVPGGGIKEETGRVRSRSPRAQQ